MLKTERIHRAWGLDDIFGPGRRCRRAEGLYLPAQCAQMWPNDGWWFHRRLPNVGEQPQKFPLYKKAEEM